MNRFPATDPAPSSHGTGLIRRGRRPGHGAHPYNLARLLRRAFGLLITLVLISATIALAQGFRSSAAVSRLTEQVLPLQVASSHLLTAQGDAQRGLRNYLNFATPGFQSLYVQAKAQLPAQMREVEKYTANNRERELTREIRQRMEAWMEFADRSDSLRPATAPARSASDRSIELYNQIWISSRKLQAHLSVEVRQLQETNEHERVLSLASLIGSALIASVMALAVSISTYRTLITPLRTMDDTLARLAAGEHEARVSEAGPAELRHVGRAINQLADESERLRGAERERTRMRQVAHDIGARIRQSLEVSTVMEEAVRALGERLDAQHVSLHLVHGGRLGPADVEWRSGKIREDVTSLPLIDADSARHAYEQGLAFNLRTSRLPDDVVPADITEAFQKLPDSAMLSVPFGSGGELIGTLLLLRPWAAGAWSASELLTAEVVAADLGHGLQQARLYEQERRLVDELRTLDLAKTDFLSTVSHELRSPLTSIVGYLELLKEEVAGSVTRHQEQMLNAVERNTFRLQLLIEDLLTLSRIESGAFRSTLQPIDISVPVNTALKTIQPLADKQGVELESDCPNGVFHIRGDLHQFERAVLNLLSNAVKFSPGGGHVTLSAHQEGDSITLAVSDTGIGIPEHDQQMMFTRFYRASNAVAGAIPGTGLGLTIVRSIVANHAGEMSIDSVEGEGTTVVMRLPRADPAADRGRL